MAEYLQLPDKSYTPFPDGLDEKGKLGFAKQAFGAFQTQFKQTESKDVAAAQAYSSKAQADLARASKTGESLAGPLPADQLADTSTMIANQTDQGKPESITDRILRYGKTAGGIALPVAGGLLGAVGGMATPVPGGALMGEMAGSAGGEYLAQKLGLSEPSNVQLGLAAAMPGAGRLVGAAGRALPISRAGATGKIAKLMPAESAKALFGQAGSAALDTQALAPAAKRVLAASQKLGKSGPDDMLGEIYDQLVPAGGSMHFKEAEALKDTLQGYINHYSNLGNAKYSPTVVQELKAIKQSLLGSIETANPGYLEALESYGRQQNIGRLTSFLSKSKDPAKQLAEMRASPLSDLKGASKRMMTGFDNAELDQIQGILERIPKSLDWKQLVAGRLAGGIVGGAIGYGAGGGKEAAGAGVLAGMLGLPIGRRMLTEMIKTGAINNPSAVSTAMQVGRAMLARLPKSVEPEAESLE